MSQLAITELRNLGPKSAEMLVSVGINTPQRLRQLGPAAAFLLVKSAFPQ